MSALDECATYAARLALKGNTATGISAPANPARSPDVPVSRITVRASVAVLGPGGRRHRSGCEAGSVRPKLVETLSKAFSGLLAPDTEDCRGSESNIRTCKIYAHAWMHTTTAS